MTNKYTKGTRKWYIQQLIKKEEKTEQVQNPIVSIVKTVIGLFTPKQKN
jgi:hypothetical protein